MSYEDNEWFEKQITSVINDALGEEYKRFVEGSEPWYVDFLRDAEEFQGDEPDSGDKDKAEGGMDAPKVYEKVRFYFDKLLLFLVNHTLLCVTYK